MSGNWQDGIDWSAPDPVELARDGIVEDEQGRLIFAAEGTAAQWLISGRPDPLADSDT